MDTFVGSMLIDQANHLHLQDAYVVSVTAQFMEGSTISNIQMTPVF